MTSRTVESSDEVTKSDQYAIADSTTPLQAAASVASGQSPGLLLSIRDVDEMQRLAGLPVDILDFKEPLSGSLASVKPSVWNQVEAYFSETRRPTSQASSWACKRPLLSAALGESAKAIELAGRLPAAFDFAKAGTWGLRDEREFADLWRTLRMRLPGSTEQVAVAYADATTAGGPEPRAVASWAAKNQLEWLLVDTYRKDGRTSLDHMGISGFRETRASCDRFGIRLVAAGGFKISDVAAFLDSSSEIERTPDYFACRGAVCRGDRAGKVERELAEALLQVLGK